MLNQEKYACEIIPVECYDSCKQIIEGVMEKEACNDNVRVGFLFGFDLGHVLPVIYIKEKGDECFLIPEESGYKEYLALHSLKRDVYVITGIRQAGSVGCTIDAMSFCKDITRRNKNTENVDFFLMHGQLIQYFAARSQKADEMPEGNYTTKLPPILLKGAQISRYIEHHGGRDSDLVGSKDTTKTLFSARNMRHVNFFKDCYNSCFLEKRRVPFYLKDKGRKYTGIIQEASEMTFDVQNPAINFVVAIDKAIEYGNNEVLKALIEELNKQYDDAPEIRRSIIKGVVERSAGRGISFDTLPPALFNEEIHKELASCANEHICSNAFSPSDSATMLPIRVT